MNWYRIIGWSLYGVGVVVTTLVLRPEMIKERNRLIENLKSTGDKKAFKKREFGLIEALLLAAACWPFFTVIFLANKVKSKYLGGSDPDSILAAHQVLMGTNEEKEVKKEKKGGGITRTSLYWLYDIDGLTPDEHMHYRIHVAHHHDFAILVDGIIKASFRTKKGFWAAAELFGPQGFAIMRLSDRRVLFPRNFM